MISTDQGATESATNLVQLKDDDSLNSNNMNTEEIFNLAKDFVKCIKSTTI